MKYEIQRTRLRWRLRVKCHQPSDGSTGLVHEARKVWDPRSSRVSVHG